MEVGYDYTTEVYSTTDADYFELSTTDDFDIDEFMTAKFDAKTKVKRNVMLEEIKDYKELPNRPIFVDYIFLEEPFEIDDKNNTKEEEDVLRTMITKKVLDNETKTVTKDDTEENMTTTDKNHIKELNNNISERLIESKYDKNEVNLEESNREDLMKPSTTKEGYLIGDEFNHEVKSQSTVEPLEITTDSNENNNDGRLEINLLTDLVDMSKMSTRSPEDVEMFTGMLKAGHPDTVSLMNCYAYAFHDL
ncbi:unnamed protein product [Arctia plantaginis]|uniref:Uncharacterized protein n=1 Tax=Arctia plantaginis TaxID=874455 RepID=A0A8S0YZV0_ARCPL|nr:unnamed protein product [Arctia plantaginis]